MTSYARPGKLFTANQNLMVAEVGHLNQAALKRITNAVVALLKASVPSA